MSTSAAYWMKGQALGIALRPSRSSPCAGCGCDGTREMRLADSTPHTWEKKIRTAPRHSQFARPSSKACAGGMPISPATTPPRRPIWLVWQSFAEDRRDPSADAADRVLPIPLQRGRAHLLEETQHPWVRFDQFDHSARMMIGGDIRKTHSGPGRPVLDRLDSER